MVIFSKLGIKFLLVSELSVSITEYQPYACQCDHHEPDYSQTHQMPFTMSPTDEQHSGHKRKKKKVKLILFSKSMVFRT